MIKDWVRACTMTLDHMDFLTQSLQGMGHELRANLTQPQGGQRAILMKGSRNMYQCLGQTMRDLDRMILSIQGTRGFQPCD